MPSADTLLLARRDQFRDEVTLRELGDVPPVDPPVDDGGGGDGDGDGLWFETLSVVLVDEAPTLPTPDAPREIFARVAARLDELMLRALRVIVDADPDQAQCWKCGDAVGWERVGLAGGGEALEWRPVALVRAVTDPGPTPVNPFCEMCGPFVTVAPFDPEGPLVTAGGWLGDLSACVKSPDGVRVLHVWLDGAGSCVCDGSVVPG